MVFGTVHFSSSANWRLAIFILQVPISLILYIKLKVQLRKQYHIPEIKALEENSSVNTICWSVRIAKAY